MSSLGSAHGARGVSVTSNSDGHVTPNDGSRTTSPHQPEPPQRRVRTQSRPENNGERNSQVNNVSPIKTGAASSFLS
jgi:hypothetical protein